MNSTGQFPSAHPCLTPAATPMRRPLARAAACAAAIAGVAISLSGCMMTYPPTTRTVLSELPEQRGATTPTLTPDEKRRYDEIGRQVLREQNDAMRAEAAARAWPYYSYAPVYGSYYSGWGHHGWSVGTGWGYPGWWW